VALLWRMRDIFFCALVDSVILCDDLALGLCGVVLVWVLMVAAMAPRLVKNARQKIRARGERFDMTTFKSF